MPYYSCVFPTLVHLKSFGSKQALRVNWPPRIQILYILKINEINRVNIVQSYLGVLLPSTIQQKDKKIRIEPLIISKNKRTLKCTAILYMRSSKAQPCSIVWCCRHEIKDEFFVHWLDQRKKANEKLSIKTGSTSNQTYLNCQWFNCMFFIYIISINIFFSCRLLWYIDLVITRSWENIDQWNIAGKIGQSNYRYKLKRNLLECETQFGSLMHMLPLQKNKHISKCQQKFTTYTSP
jgi:hypothetical protein